MPQYTPDQLRERRRRGRELRQRRDAAREDDDEPMFAVARRTEPPAATDLFYVPYGGTGRVEDNAKRMFAELEVAKAAGMTPAPPQKFFIRHRDGNPLNNMRANLEVVLVNE